MKANFHDIHAARTTSGQGQLKFQFTDKITDIVRRRGLFGQRIEQVPATGHPSRFFEETAIPEATAGYGFCGSAYISAPLVSPSRIESAVPLKALVAQINYNLFDFELGNQQSQFASSRRKILRTAVLKA